MRGNLLDTVWTNFKRWIDWQTQEWVDGVPKQIYKHRADELAVQREREVTRAGSARDREDEK